MNAEILDIFLDYWMCIVISSKAVNYFRKRLILDMWLGFNNATLKHAKSW